MGQPLPNGVMMLEVHFGQINGYLGQTVDILTKSMNALATSWIFWPNPGHFGQNPGILAPSPACWPNP